MAADLPQDAIVARFMSALESAGDLAVLDEICVPTVAAEWRSIMTGFAFDDRVFTIDQILSDGAQVAILWSLTARHIGEYGGVAATGIHTSNTGSSFFTFDDGKIATVLAHYDADAVYEQIGAVIGPPR